MNLQIFSTYADFQNWLDNGDIPSDKLCYIRENGSIFLRDVDGISKQYAKAEVPPEPFDPQPEPEEPEVISPIDPSKLPWGTYCSYVIPQFDEEYPTGLYYSTSQLIDVNVDGYQGEWPEGKQIHFTQYIWENGSGATNFIKCFSIDTGFGAPEVLTHFKNEQNIYYPIYNHGDAPLQFLRRDAVDEDGNKFYYYENVYSYPGCFYSDGVWRRCTNIDGTDDQFFMCSEDFIFWTDKNDVEHAFVGYNGLNGCPQSIFECKKLLVPCLWYSKKGVDGTETETETPRWRFNYGFEYKGKTYAVTSYYKEEEVEYDKDGNIKPYSED